MMAKLIGLVVALSSLVVVIAEAHQFSCDGIPQFTFGEMKKPEHMCSFMFVESDDKIKEDTSLEAMDKQQTCGCNIMNKGMVWAGMVTGEVDKLYSYAEDRLNLDESKISSSVEEQVQKTPKDKVLFRLVRGKYKEDGRYMVYEPRYPEKEIMKTCQELKKNFEPVYKMLHNLTVMMATTKLRSDIIRAQRNLMKLFVSYKVCRRIGYLEEPAEEKKQ